MEHISKVLGNLPKNTATQTISGTSEEELELSPADELIRKLTRFNISSLEHTFENFKELAKTKEAKEAMAFLEAVSEGKSDRQFILLYGITGCGKTYLIEATILGWAARGLFARYHTFSEIARRLKSSLRIPEGYDRIFKGYCEVERLIVDDVGMGTTESRFEISDLEDIMDMRYRKRYYPDTKMVTIMASNKDIKDLPDRIVSRFYDPEFGKILYLGDIDYRRRKV